jgi:hypothetical protein
MEKLDAEMNKIRSDRGYWDKSAPNHRALQTRIQELLQQRYGDCSRRSLAPDLSPTQRRAGALIPDHLVERRRRGGRHEMKPIRWNEHTREPGMPFTGATELAAA